MTPDQILANFRALVQQSTVEHNKLIQRVQASADAQQALQDTLKALQDAFDSHEALKADVLAMHQRETELPDPSSQR